MRASQAHNKECDTTNSWLTRPAPCSKRNSNGHHSSPVSTRRGIPFVKVETPSPFQVLSIQGDNCLRWRLAFRPGLWCCMCAPMCTVWWVLCQSRKSFHKSKQYIQIQILLTQPQ